MQRSFFDLQEREGAGIEMEKTSVLSLHFEVFDTTVCEVRDLDERTDGIRRAKPTRGSKVVICCCVLHVHLSSITTTQYRSLHRPQGRARTEKGKEENSSWRDSVASCPGIHLST